MTRLAILSDIHGNLPALQAVMADMAAFHFDHVVVAGDVVNWGPFSAPVAEIVIREGWAVIRGNNEFYLLDYNTPRQPEHWRHFTLLPWLYEQLQGRLHRQIAAWPDELSLRFPDAPPVRIVHGKPGSPWISLHPLMTDEELTAHLDSTEEPTLIAGHSHIPLNRRVGRWHVINPGSVGVPLDGKPGVASYVILDGDGEGWTPTYRRVRFDLEPLIAEFERQGFLDRMGGVGRLIMKEFETARVWVYAYNAWRNGQPDTPETLRAFEQVDPWAYLPPEYDFRKWKPSF